MSEQVKLPGQRFTARVCLTHEKVLHGADLCTEPFRDAAGNTKYCDSAVEVDLLTVETAQRALRKALAQRDAEWREGLASDAARNALYDAHMHYQARAPHEQSEDGWLDALLAAVRDQAAPDRGEH